MNLETARLLLRPMTMADAPDVFEYSKNPKLGQNAGWKPHESLEETRKIMEAIFVGQKTIWGIQLKENPKLIGSIGLIGDPKRENSAILMMGYALAEEYWGQGIVSEAAERVIRFGREELKLEGISAYTFPFNRRSQSILAKNGFKWEGRLSRAERAYDGQVLDNDCYLKLFPENFEC